MKYYCDKYRHLVCVPFSVENLHEMAADLKIDKAWFHLGNKYQGRSRLTHYDIPINRISEIKAKCTVVSKNQIVKIIRGLIP